MPKAGSDTAPDCWDRLCAEISAMTNLAAHGFACEIAERSLLGDCDPRLRAAIAIKRQWIRGEVTVTDDVLDAARDKCIATVRASGLGPRGWVVTFILARYSGHTAAMSAAAASIAAGDDVEMMVADIRRWSDPCEYNPLTGRPAWTAEDAHASADVIVGENGRWRLCEECAKLPEFKKFRKRIPIVKPEETK